MPNAAEFVECSNCTGDISRSHPQTLLRRCCLGCGTLATQCPPLLWRTTWQGLHFSFWQQVEEEVLETWRSEIIICIIHVKVALYQKNLGKGSNTTLRILSVKRGGGAPQIRNPLFAEKNSVKEGRGVPPKSVTHSLPPLRTKSAK